MQRAKIIAIIVLVVLGCIVLYQNRESAETRILFVTVTMPRAVMLALTLGMGYVLGILTVLIMQRRKPKDGAKDDKTEKK